MNTHNNKPIEQEAAKDLANDAVDALSPYYKRHLT